MPIYEYRCRECGNHFQLLQSMNASIEGLSCPRCASDQVERQLSTFASTTSTPTPCPPAGCGGGGG